MFRIIREISATVKMANDIAAQQGDGPRWTLFLTNRSFIAQVVALSDENSVHVEPSRTATEGGHTLEPLAIVVGLTARHHRGTTGPHTEVQTAVAPDVELTVSVA